jgi:hypothetical protein
MKKRHPMPRLFSRSSALALLLTAVAAGPAAADAATQTAAANCQTPELSQPFSAWGDINSYALVPGEAADAFAGDGWTLDGGASTTTATLADGSSGSVLDLPAGGYAVSPPVCVQSDYRTARTMFQTENGARVEVGVFSDDSHRLRLSGTLGGDDSSWSLSDPLEVHPGLLPGWSLVRFVFADESRGGDAQIYNFYVDPRMSD